MHSIKMPDKASIQNVKIVCTAALDWRETKNLVYYYLRVFFDTGAVHALFVQHLQDERMPGQPHWLARTRHFQTAAGIRRV